MVRSTAHAALEAFSQARSERATSLSDEPGLGSVRKDAEERLSLGGLKEDLTFPQRPSPWKLKSSQTQPTVQPQHCRVMVSLLGQYCGSVNLSPAPERLKLQARHFVVDLGGLSCQTSSVWQ